jgi:phosphotransferase system HPr (HPr) family protein
VAAGRFAAAVSVTAGSHTADAKSVLGVMGLGATSGQHVTVSAAGPDAREAVAALITILTQATKVGGLLRNCHVEGQHLLHQKETTRPSSHAHCPFRAYLVCPPSFSLRPGRPVSPEPREERPAAHRSC